MSYEIIIREKREVKKFEGKVWSVIDTEEVAREQNFYSRDENEPKTRIKEVHGYTPEIERTVVETRDILIQTVDDLDLPAVIKAINNL